MNASATCLRRHPPPELPERPYPLLLPYTHPALLRGRERELSELRRRLRLPVPILGLSAPSGTGKSSLLLGGLVPALRREGWPVALVRHPHEPGLAGRLLGDLVDGEPNGAGSDPGHPSFVNRLLDVERLADGVAPILVLDQFEDVLRRDDAVAARAALGLLLAATVRRRPGRETPPCRWLLAYRQEYHGDVVAWLGDVLRDARAEGLPADESLPHDLAKPDRFQSLALPPLATTLRGADPAAEASRLFRTVIESPLALLDEQGKPRYPWRFAGDGAARLAGAFGAARVARPDAPLTPELQVVLAHLLAEADDGAVAVPDDPGKLIDAALEEHLRRALEAAFPAGRTPAGAAGRARALLALRELASATGEREEGLPVDALSHAIGPGGEEILEQLATAQTRLVVLREHPEGWRYALSHDRMAEVVVRMVEQEGRRGGLVVDSELLALRRFVTLNTALYHGREEQQATRLPRRHYRRIAAHADALLWDAERRRWWAACRRRRRADRRRAAAWTMAAVIVLALAATGAWNWARRLRERRALLEQIAGGEPEAALAAFDRLAASPDADFEELRSRLRQRESPMDLLERGMGGVSEERRSAAVLRAVEIALPLVDGRPEQADLIADMVWALDIVPCREASYASRARALRDRVLEPLRRRRPPPAVPGPGDPDWASIPGGTFLMGTGADEGRDEEEMLKERPQHQVTVSPFRMLRHEVTNGEYRRLFPDHREEAADLPARWVSWYEAYTYAAWLGGRLPTEAEWEYAARAGCPFAYCARDGEEASVDQMAWTRRNTSDPETRECTVQPVKRLEPNQWGLFDIYGNVWEKTADWFAAYSAHPQVDPWGPFDGEGRVSRGGAYFLGEEWAQGTGRAVGGRRAGGGRGKSGGGGGGDIGLRVAMPACR